MTPPEFEAQLDRALKNLPDITAPRGLLPRVLSAIEALNARPWYARAFDSWPAHLRFALVLVLCGGFALLCFGGWRAKTAEPVSEGLASLNAVYSVAGALVNSLGVIKRGLFSIATQQYGAYALGCLAAALLGFSICATLITWFVRFGLASQKRTL